MTYIISYNPHRSPSFTLKVRRTMMSLLTCIKRYASHIEAIKGDAKVQDMPRISYLETKFDTIMDPDHTEQDRKYIEDDLESMGVFSLFRTHINSLCTSKRIIRNSSSGSTRSRRSSRLKPRRSTPGTNPSTSMESTRYPTT